MLNNIEDEFGIEAIGNLEQTKSIDCLVLAVIHDDFSGITLEKLKNIMNSNPVLIDVRAFYNREQAERRGFHYKTL